MNKAFEKIIERIDKEIPVYTEKAKQIVQEVAEEYNGGWIACSERLPENIDFVLYTHKDGEVDICSIEYFYDYMDRFTAWQPLPEPFKEREANG